MTTQHHLYNNLGDPAPTAKSKEHLTVGPKNKKYLISRKPGSRKKHLLSEAVSNQEIFNCRESEETLTLPSMSQEIFNRREPGSEETLTLLKSYPGLVEPPPPLPHHLLVPPPGAIKNPILKIGSFLGFLPPTPLQWRKKLLSHRYALKQAGLCLLLLLLFSSLFGSVFPKERERPICTVVVCPQVVGILPDRKSSESFAKNKKI